MKLTMRLLGPGLLIVSLAGCSKPINSRVAGQYEEQAKAQSTGGGSFYVKENGYCSVSEPSSPRGGSSRVLTGNCEQAGEGAIKWTLKGRIESDFGYPDFRGESTILLVEGNNLVTRNGTRFVWKYK